MINLQDLPDEILQRIMEFCRPGDYLYSFNNGKVFCSLCLTSKRFTPLAQTALFRVVLVWDYEERGNIKRFTTTIQEYPRLADKVRVLDVSLVTRAASQQSALPTCLNLCKNIQEVRMMDAQTISACKEALEGANRLVKLRLGGQSPLFLNYDDIIRADLPVRSLPQVEIKISYAIKPYQNNDDAGERVGKLRAKKLRMACIGHAKVIGVSDWKSEEEKLLDMHWDDDMATQMLSRMASPQFLHLCACVFTPRTLSALSSYVAADVVHLRLEDIEVSTIDEILRDARSILPEHQRPPPSLSFPLASFTSLKILELGSRVPRLSDPPARLEVIRLRQLDSGTIDTLHSILMPSDLPSRLRLELLGLQEVQWEDDPARWELRNRMAEQVPR